MKLFKKKNDENGEEKKQKTLSDFAFMAIFFIVVVVAFYSIFVLIRDKRAEYIQPSGGQYVSIDYSASSSATMPSVVGGSLSSTGGSAESVKEASLAGGGVSSNGTFSPEDEAEGIDYESLPFYQRAKEYQQATEGASGIDPSTLSSEWNSYEADLKNAPYSADGSSEELLSDDSSEFPSCPYTVLYKILDNYGWTHYQLLSTDYEDGGYYLMYTVAVGYSNEVRAQYSIYYAASDNVAFAYKVEEGYYQEMPDVDSDAWTKF